MGLVSRMGAPPKARGSATTEASDRDSVSVSVWKVRKATMRGWRERGRSVDIGRDGA